MICHEGWVSAKSGCPWAYLAHRQGRHPVPSALCLEILNSAEFNSWRGREDGRANLPVCKHWGCFWFSVPPIGGTPPAHPVPSSLLQPVRILSGRAVGGGQWCPLPISNSGHLSSPSDCKDLGKQKRSPLPPHPPMPGRTHGPQVVPSSDLPWLCRFSVTRWHHSIVLVPFHGPWVYPAVL